MNKTSEDILNTLISMAERNELTGCFADIPIEVYHHPLCPGISSTQIKGILKKSYKHYELEKSTGSKATRFGSAFHCFVNEPEAFVNTYQITYDRKKDLINPTKIQLSYQDFELIQKMSKNLFDHPDAAPLLKGAQYELTYFSVDRETGILKKCRVDAIKNNIISDLKTCEDASEDAFARDCRKHLYRVSAAFYLEVVSEVLDQRLNTFNLIACEKSDPYEVNVFKVHESSLQKGNAEVRTALNLIKTIHDQPKAWRGYKLGVKEIAI